jgi:hypothetical protein
LPPKPPPIAVNELKLELLPEVSGAPPEPIVMVYDVVDVSVVVPVNKPPAPPPPQIVLPPPPPATIKYVAVTGGGANMA